MSEYNLPLAVIINGTSSVGKSAAAGLVANSFPGIGVPPPALLKIDSFINILPQDLVGNQTSAARGILFVQNPEFKTVTIKVGDLGNAVVLGMHNLAQQLLLLNQPIIIDHVILLPEWRDHLVAVLEHSQANILHVLLTCDPIELARREKQRGDRRPGLAQGLASVVKTYAPKKSIIIDTTEMTPKEVGQYIISLIKASSYEE